MKKIRFPQHVKNLSDVQRIFAPERISLVAITTVSVLITESLMLSAGISICLSWAFMKYAERRPDGFLLHAAYWYGLYPIKARTAINPFLRRIDPL